MYGFKGISFNDYPDNVALSDIIVPGVLWLVVVIAHNKPLYEFTLIAKAGKVELGTVTIPNPIGSEFIDHLWVPLLKAYPESTGIKPILVAFGLNRGFAQQHHLLYFPQLGPRKIYYCDRRGFTKIDTLLTASIETLDDSKTLMKYLKKREASGEGKPMRLEKTKAEPKEWPSPPPMYMQGSLKAGDSSALFPVRGGGK